MSMEDSPLSWGRTGRPHEREKAAMPRKMLSERPYVRLTKHSCGDNRIEAAAPVALSPEAARGGSAKRALRTHRDARVQILRGRPLAGHPVSFYMNKMRLRPLLDFQGTAPILLTSD